MFYMALLISAVGLMFIASPRYVTHASNRRMMDRTASKWIGYSLIMMSCLFLIMGVLQMLDQASHHMDH
ncbi:TRAP-type C4-dicarboxylate transport system permease small subunit [Paenibacillus amylolyticus]|uniref:TRAP-type C4-dicarboxylate transport system permease small subunit n=1 Tax=Paenibacillus amylolyticus TaxID=1451 RepID=A0AAP5LPZ2_PAEAM|nr:hypothetical protein [Paenibacillus amylolyticus]MDR6726801.1 TRAP-type C4-dicarboxylate transport system permease small subunit [Paenibacillus amylolyticus]